MADLKVMLKDVVSRFKKANAAENETTKRMLQVQEAAKRVSKEVKEQKE